MLVQCPSCAKQLNVPESAAGKKAKCPACTKVFDIPAPAAVAVMPAAPKAPPPARRTDDEDDDRPRRRSRADDDDEDDDDRPRGKRRQDDEDDDAPRGRQDELDEVDDDDRPVRKRGGGVREMAGTVAMWLKLSAFMLIGYFVVSLINSYLTTAAAMRLIFGNGPMPPFAPSPMGSTLIALVVGLVILSPCLVFMFMGASKVVKTTGRGFVLAGLIIAIVLGSLIAIGAIFGLIGVFTLMLSFMQPIFLVVAVATATVLLIGGIKGLSIMGQRAMKEAFGVRDQPRRGRARDRDDRDDEEEDDDRDERPRRRGRADD